VGALLVAVPSAALAHDGRPLEPHDLWHAWEWNPAVTAPLAIVALLYALGVARLWGSAGTGRGVRRIDAVAFAGGWLTLVGALVSPLHALGGALFAAHMAQHELLMVVAAPLLVLGRPVIALLWGLPRAVRRSIGVWAGEPHLRATWRTISRPTVAWLIHTIALAVWHLPALYDATVVDGVAHAAQHASFLGTALLFWWAVLNPGREGYGVAVGTMFATSIVTGAIGALLAFAPAIWYQVYVATTGPWGLTPLEDQQLGGIIMWIPGGVSYLVAGIALFGLWLRQSSRRASRMALAASTVCLVIAVAGGCERASYNLADLTGGNADRGRTAIRQYGCGACHTIRGVPGANGLVGPPLNGVALRSYVAGVLPNTPENMVRWIQDPPSVDPKTAMPNVGVTYQDALDIAGYLYTIK
jgi:cytochrome c oxidase assembly factor CtaG